MTLLDLARELGAARKAWAMDFLLFRNGHLYKSDQQARAAADEIHIENITMLEAKYQIALYALREGHGTTASATGTDSQPTQATSDTEGEGPDCGD